MFLNFSSMNEQKPFTNYFLAAHGFLVIISIAAWICVLAFGGLAHKTLIRIMTTGFSPGGATEMLADLAIVGASKFPSALSVLLVSVFRRLFITTCLVINYSI